MEVTATKPTFPKYPAYKDSGVEWLGEIPERWGLRRFKYLFKEINERSTDGTGDLLSVSQYTGVTKKSDKVDEGDLLTTASTLEGYKKVYQSDLVSNIMLAWNGSLGFSPFDGITSPAYSIYRLYKGNSERFFHYLVRSQIYKSEFKRNSSGVIESRLRLYTDDFFAIWSILPTPSEQTAIANFLDDKTAKIDRAIAQKEQLIALLKERKQIIIQNAVTKGLDPNVKMKDSCVEWIGEIPEHWKVVKAKYTFGKIEQGWSPQCDSYVADKNQWGVLKVGCVNHGSFNEDENKLLPLSLKPKLEYQIKEGDILISRANSLELVGSAACVMNLTRNLILCDKLYRVNLYSKVVDKLFFINLFKTKIARRQIEIEANGASPSMQNIGQDVIKNMIIPLCTLKEQREIGDFIETQSAKIDQAISLQKKQIQKLKEYKATLIDSAVTGKIKVSEL